MTKNELEAWVKKLLNLEWLAQLLLTRVGITPWVNYAKCLAWFSLQIFPAICYIPVTKFERKDQIIAFLSSCYIWDTWVITDILLKRSSRELFKSGAENASNCKNKLERAFWTIKQSNSAISLSFFQISQRLAILLERSSWNFWKEAEDMPES